MKWRNPVLKIVSVSLAVSLFTTNVLLAHLPEVAVRKIAVSPNRSASKTVIHIQDVHMNAEAQRNIGKELQALIDHKQVDFVALEGAFGPMDFSVFREFPYQDPIKAVAGYLFDAKKISGAVHTALTSRAAIPRFVGVDDAAHYAANVDAYRRSAALTPSIKARLIAIENRLNQEKAVVFKKTLADFDARVQAYRRGELAWGNYVRFLASHAASVPRDAGLFLEALRRESSLDFAEVERQRTRLITHLLSKLPKSESADFLNHAAAFQSGNCDHTDFYRYLQDLCRKNKIELSRYPAMDSYLQYVVLSHAVSVENVLRDVASLENSSFAKLATTTGEKNLLATSQRLYLTAKLLNFSLSKDEWTEYTELKSASNEIGDLSSFEDFYKEALQRDLSMAQNLIEEMEESKASSVVLITGGFHSAGIEEQLQRKGIATVTYVPKITKVGDSDGSGYLGIFAREKAPLDKLFAGEKLFVNPPPMVKARPFLILAIITTMLAYPAASLKNLLKSTRGIVPRDAVARADSSGRLSLETSDDGVKVSTGIERRGTVVKLVRPTAVKILKTGAVAAAVFALAQSGFSPWIVTALALCWVFRAALPGIVRVVISEQPLEQFFQTPRLLLREAEIEKWGNVVPLVEPLLLKSGLKLNPDLENEEVLLVGLGQHASSIIKFLKRFPKIKRAIIVEPNRANVESLVKGLEGQDLDDKLVIYRHTLQNLPEELFGRIGLAIDQNVFDKHSIPAERREAETILFRDSYAKLLKEGGVYITQGLFRLDYPPDHSTMKKLPVEVAPLSVEKRYHPLITGDYYVKSSKTDQAGLALFTAALPGLLVYLGGVLAGLAIQQQIPLWLYGVPLLFVLILSMGAGGDQDFYLPLDNDPLANRAIAAFFRTPVAIQSQTLEDIQKHLRGVNRWTRRMLNRYPSSIRSTFETASQVVDEALVEFTFRRFLALSASLEEYVRAVNKAIAGHSNGASEKNRNRFMHWGRLLADDYNRILPSLFPDFLAMQPNAPDMKKQVIIGLLDEQNHLYSPMQKFGSFRDERNAENIVQFRTADDLFAKLPPTWRILMIPHDLPPEATAPRHVQVLRRSRLQVTNVVEKMRSGQVQQRWTKGTAEYENELNRIRQSEFDKGFPSADTAALQSARSVLKELGWQSVPGQRWLFIDPPVAGLPNFAALHQQDVVVVSSNKDLIALLTPADLDGWFRSAGGRFRYLQGSAEQGETLAALEREDKFDYVVIHASDEEQLKRLLFRAQDWKVAGKGGWYVGINGGQTSQEFERTQNGVRSIFNAVGQKDIDLIPAIAPGASSADRLGLVIPTRPRIRVPNSLITYFTSIFLAIGSLFLVPGFSHAGAVRLHRSNVVKAFKWKLESQLNDPVEKLSLDLTHAIHPQGFTVRENRWHTAGFWWFLIGLPLTLVGLGAGTSMTAKLFFLGLVIFIGLVGLPLGMARGDSTPIKILSSNGESIGPAAAFSMIHHFRSAPGRLVMLRNFQEAEKERGDLTPDREDHYRTHIVSALKYKAFMRELILRWRKGSDQPSQTGEKSNPVENEWGPIKIDYARPELRSA